MIVDVCGIQEVDFNTKDGKHIKGTKIYVFYKMDYVKGVKADSVFLGSSFDSSSIKVGSKVSFETDFHGKVIGVTPIKVNPNE